MSSNLHTIDLTSSDPNTREQMVFMNDPLFVPMDMVVGGKLITHFDVREMQALDELLVVLPGLPGGEFGLEIDRKAREVVNDSEVARGVLRLIPEGVSAKYDLGISAAEEDQCRTENSDFFGQQFSFDRFLMYYTAAMQAVNQRLSAGCRVHAAAHSYGAISLLHGMRMWWQDGTPMPNSVSFLAPFVQLAVDAQDPDIALNLIKTRLRVSETVDTLAQRRALTMLLKESQQYLNCGGGQTLFNQHRRVFNGRVFHEIGDLKNAVANKGRSCAVRIVRGEDDPYIGDGHAQLIADRTGCVREEIERAITGGHALESLDVASLFVPPR